MSRIPANTLYGSIDLLILRTLHTTGPLHGFGIANEIARLSSDELRIEEGALYPALHRLKREGFITGEWRISDKNRRARFYSLTDKGRVELEQTLQEWLRHTGAMCRVLQVAGGDLSP